MAKKKEKKFTNSQIIVLVFLLAILAVITFFFYPQDSRQFTPEEGPPTLEIGAMGFQGTIEDDRGLLTYTAADVAAYVNPVGLPQITIKQGVHYYYSTETVTVQDIIDNIKPVNNNKILIADYNATHNKFYTYPEGPYFDTETISNPAFYFIEANHGFFIISKEETTAWGIKGEDQPLAGTFTDNPFTDATYKWLNNSNVSGWVLLPTASNFSSFLNNQALSSIVEAVYTTDNTGSEPAFQEQTPNLNYPGGYYFSTNADSYMVWIYIKEDRGCTNCSQSCTGCPSCADTATGVNCNAIGFYSGYSCGSVSGGSPICPSISSQTTLSSFTGCYGCTGCTGCGGCYVFDGELICHGPGLGFSGNTECSTVSNYRAGYRATLCPNGSFANYENL